MVIKMDIEDIKGHDIEKMSLVMNQNVSILVILENKYRKIKCQSIMLFKREIRPNYHWGRPSLFLAWKLHIINIKVRRPVYEKNKINVWCPRSDHGEENERMKIRIHQRIKCQEAWKIKITLIEMKVYMQSIKSYKRIFHVII